MCGIFGVIAGKESKTDFQWTEKVLQELFILSESRGKESSGVAVKDIKNNRISVTKDDIPATELIHSPGYKKFLEDNLRGNFNGTSPKYPISVMAHSRLVTNGTQENNNNNQPVIKDGIVMIHNGIITNVDELWKKHAGKIQREYEVDTEALASLIRLRIKEGKDTAAAVTDVFNEIEGAASIAVMFNDRNQVVLATNTGSLYFCLDTTGKSLIFGSEEYILKTLLEKSLAGEQFVKGDIKWLKPFTGKLVDLDSFSISDFSFSDSSLPKGTAVPLSSCEIVNFSAQQKSPSAFTIHKTDHARLEKLLEFNSAAISKLKRCSKCLLPETFPFIDFDGQGACNYCKNYRSKNLKVDKRDQFRAVLDKYRTKNGKPDCIVAFSGGRDSSYGLHLLKKEFGMHPLTFTYDWGMVTDLARRNIARITGKLGIENILVSADIKMKRDNIHKNVSAWLKRPALGMIPLFMAGDKHFFKYVNIIRKQTGIPCDIWMENKLENTDFKAGFAGIRPNFGKDRIDRQSTLAKLQMPMYYMKNFIMNPAYLNSSLPDTYSSFKAYYMEPREVYLLLFDYIPWDEKMINDALINEYNWELAPDTKSTWRIGDGTAPFYNYIYYTVTGFSEFDTFRSNQIREGMMSREEGLALIADENRPRYESMKWYLDTIRIDFEKAIRIINNIPKLYTS